MDENDYRNIYVNNGMYVDQPSPNGHFMGIGGTYLGAVGYSQEFPLSGKM